MSAPPRPPQNGSPSPAEVRTVRPSDLSAADLAAWTALHRRRPELASPYFHPTFVRSVAEARAAHGKDDVRVGVIRPGGEPGAAATVFFPFQSDRWGRATPPGGRLCDVHGVVAAADASPRGEELLRGCGLRSYAFHMLPPGQGALRRAAPGASTETRTGVRVNLAGGFDAYIARREEAGSKRHRKITQFRRRMEREYGDAIFTWHDPDPEAWDCLLRWKRAQYAATGFCDVLAAPWVRDLLARCRDAGSTDRPEDPGTSGDGFAGVFCTLRAGGRIAAVHLLLRSGPRLHAWFPAYDIGAKSVSPGNVLMLELLRHAADRGVTAVDLGAGDEPYKADYATESFPLHGGVAEAPGPLAELNAAARRVRDALKSHPAGAPARALAARVRPLRERLSLR